MDNLFLDVTERYVDESKITQIEYHSFLPFSTTALSRNDEIRFSISESGSYTLPSHSFLNIEGKITKGSGSLGEIRFINNGLAHLFSECRYEINNTEIQSVRNPGITSTLKGLCSYTESDKNALFNAAWDITGDNCDEFVEKGFFSGCIPLKHLFGFCEDYKKILINTSQQLILNRASIDFDSLVAHGGGNEEQLKKHEGSKLEITKIVWKMPLVKVSDEEKLKLLKVVDSQKPLSLAYRNWQLCEYPVLPTNTSHSWSVRSCSNIERPRYAIIGFQTDRKNSYSKSLSMFDHCNLKNLKVYLNTEAYPYEDFQADFTNSKVALLYNAYCSFQKSYYERDWSSPLMSKHDFMNKTPVVVIDMSRQDDNIKLSNVDIRIEFETTSAIPEKTSAYCLILHDQIANYNPFTGDVRKL
ncbi:uncharacterized protein LOC126845123 [Adelges cooleyi]|uniref:uncharacterized protein LOC126833166 n=1 Tax=Adelges cooleyi TaxID=133065 RepID=UPI00218074D8|nr:uncharacterized protein LOC126833166 [Adelges cooleyi]XP_050439637.1 uncharacterized protein LOC126845123 [Adelges cooleyi]